MRLSSEQIVRHAGASSVCAGSSKHSSRGSGDRNTRQVRNESRSGWANIPALVWLQMVFPVRSQKAREKADLEEHELGMRIAIGCIGSALGVLAACVYWSRP